MRFLYLVKTKKIYATIMNNNERTEIDGDE